MKRILLPSVLALLCLACATQRKLDGLTAEGIMPTLSNSVETLSPMEADYSPAPMRDTLTVTDNEGNEVLIMRAVKDEDGEMVATDVLDAAVVSAKFRHVAERNGKIDLTFRINVPADMQDSRWQIRLRPLLYLPGDTLRLEPILITGDAYRNIQLRGYQQYERFINSIITDSTQFINASQLEVFIERNLPELHALKKDSSYVSDDHLLSLYGVSEREAVRHYTNMLARNRNDKRISRTETMFRRYIKSPIVSEGIRLDTIIRSGEGNFIYEYVQTVNTNPNIKKIDAVLSGGIFEQDQRLYTIPQTEPLTFYISSLSTLADDSERYLSRIVERSVEANTACYIEFEQGQSRVIPDMGNNAEEISRIKSNLRELMDSETLMLDSILVTASSSPEGSWKYNSELSQRRSEAVAAYFDKYLAWVEDSLRTEQRRTVNLDGEYPFIKAERKPISFISRNNPENWRMLDALVREDGLLSEADKISYMAASATEDPDGREKLLQNRAYYRYLREKLYPRLRTVRFDFYLHRKGMVKDTVHTTILDTTYMRGLQAIKDRDYPLAVTLLRPYEDLNTAIAYCAMEYNESAYELLTRLDKTASVNYMLAIVQSRRGDDRAAVEYYLRSCEQNPSFVHRGGLDPEISALIKKYNIHKMDDELISE